MRRLLYLTVLSMLVVAMTASVALAQPQRAPSGADGSYNCADFDTQTQAQNYYNSQGGLSGGDPDGLDRDQDGLACEDSLQAGDENATTTTDDEGVAPADDDGAVAPTENDDETVAQMDDDAGATQYAGDDQYADDGAMTELPDTGGPTLPLLAGGLALIVGGLLLYKRLS